MRYATQEPTAVADAAADAAADVANAADAVANADAVHLAASLPHRPGVCLEMC